MNIFFRLPCEIQWRYTEKGEKVRVSVRSGRIVPVPIVARETYDFKTPTSYEGIYDQICSFFVNVKLYLSS